VEGGRKDIRPLKNFIPLIPEVAFWRRVHHGELAD